ncbi:hypothetical protein DFH09DRAFT_1469300 [Mycena vulgaris]|nr:hypothetical protein DFH09DRAFT_1469300 [Mycena vulgaris]
MDATEWRTPWNCLEIRPGGGNVLRFYELGSVPLKDPQQRYTVLSTAAADAQKGYLGDQWRYAAAADVAHRLSTKPLNKPTPTPPPTSTALDNASRSPRPTPPTALNVINIINATQLRWTPPTPTPSCSGRCHAVAFAITAVTATEPWGGFGGDDGRCRI